MKALALTISLLLVLTSINIACAEEFSSGGVGMSVVLLNYDPYPAQPNQFVKLYIKVENRGGEVIKNALYKLEPAYPFSLKPGENAERFYGSLGSYQPVVLEYDLFVDKNTIEGTYPLELKFCTDSDCTNWVSNEIEVTVQTGGVPGIETGFENFDTFSSGKTGEITAFIVNRGDLGVKYLVIELEQTEQFDIVSPNEIYIGDMDSDDYETADFKIHVHSDVASNGTQTVILPLKLSYTDVNDKAYTDSQNLELRVYTMKDLIKMGLVKNYSSVLQYLLLAAGAIVILFLIYRSYKKKES